MHDHRSPVSSCRSARGTRAIIAAIALLLSGSPVSAEITAADCDRLKAENAALVAQGVPKLMEKGPDWAKANLDAGRLASIKRLIDVSEQIMFRCEQLKPINTKVEQVETEGAESDDGQPQAGTTPAAPKAAAMPVPKTATVPKAVPKAQDLAVAPKAAQEQTAPKAAAKPKPAPARTGGEPPQPTAADLVQTESRRAPKAKANDAYTPAAGGSTLDQQIKP